ncbi:MAG TPA: type II secretion system F family protein [Actinomycetota bacterium]
MSIRWLGALLARLAWIRRLAASHVEPELLIGRAAPAALLGALVAVASTSGARAAAAAPLGLLGGWRLGVFVHERERRALLAEVRRALPDALDRLTTCVLAGLSVERALRTVTPRTPGALGEAFAAGSRALDLGVPRSRAYTIVAERAPAEEVRGLMASLARAERFGTSLSDALLAQANELRSRARAAAEAEARTAPVKLIFPLVFCFLPAFIVLTIVPIAVSAIRTLGGI